MEVIEYIRNNGVEALKEEFGIIVKEYPNGLMVLNYDQIRSPKTEVIVQECRGLILEQDTFNVVSRSFDRFFNYGEAPDTQHSLDMSSATVYEKVDGSLIKIYYYGGNWHISTRGTAFAESETSMGIKFYELVHKALDCQDEDDFQFLCDKWLHEDWTYIFEITSVENRVVKHYTGYTLYYLASRHNNTGVYGDDYEARVAYHMGVVLPKRYNFQTLEQCVEASKELKDLDEGYVVYNENGEPICKIKSPAYLAVHRIRGEGLSPKRIMQLVLMNEQDEYLSYFPEDEKFFVPYVFALKELLDRISYAWEWNKKIGDQKEFALKVKHLPFSSVLFQAKSKGLNPVNVFHSMGDNIKMKMLEYYVNA